MTTQATESVEMINTLICSIEGRQVMLPDVAIAEIVDYQPTSSDEDSPVWLLGNLLWRDLQVPVVSLEALDHGSMFAQGDMLKIIVVNGMNQRDSLPYWGFVAQETPRMMRLNKESLVKDESAELGAVEAMRAEVYGEPVLLPDLSKVEKAIAEQLG